ncbi:iron chelate uptake ABC transporter family permease subunit [Brevibacterium linens]|uniref:Iron complex transport system permease protein n=2 Tax=Brevibacterium linens TaxID=1703 RepID=A0A2H1K530_BRELN|nr:iron chelate uptake ABC transporter family permease subunit [Brevibacterium linens]KAB1949068.1 iron chelate uptake ABC transporter family permease subunit [Brevibacterium linens ATCC 9172]SMX69664.1 iron complex transport system permease protein [Brevibacterium linens ATCC 9172]SMX94392.1 iron complex transport system permease protein [Brevibacterium linens]
MTGSATSAEAKPHTDTSHPAGGSLRIRRVLGLVAAIIALILVIAASLAIGARDMPISEVLGAFFAPTGSDDQLVVLELRLPRTVLGILVGMGLGLAGGLIQALTRNPLADPGILGVNAGASLAITIGVAFFGISSITGYIWFAFAGALVATVGVYVIGSAGRSRTVDPIRLTLAGVAVAAVLTGLTKAILLTNERAFDAFRSWDVGAIAGRDFDTITAILPFIGIGTVLALALSHSLNAVALGDDLAASLGTSVNRTRVLSIIAVTLLAGAATAAAGPIGFIGLMIPHIARWIVGPDQRWILGYSLVLAPILLLASDVIGRVVMKPGELQVGVVTAFVGAPVLIALVRRKKASGL